MENSRAQSYEAMVLKAWPHTKSLGKTGKQFRCLDSTWNEVNLNLWGWAEEHSMLRITDLEILGIVLFLSSHVCFPELGSFCFVFS